MFAYIKGELAEIGKNYIVIYNITLTNNYNNI